MPPFFVLQIQELEQLLERMGELLECMGGRDVAWRTIIAGRCHLVRQAQREKRRSPQPGYICIRLSFLLWMAADTIAQSTPGQTAPWAMSWPLYAKTVVGQGTCRRSGTMIFTMYRFATKQHDAIQHMSCLSCR